MIRAGDSWKESDKYDAILIDEAQDFKADWFRCVTGLLKGGTEGSLLIATDGAQSLYPHDRNFTWKSVGVNAVGRVRRLSRCYRTTKEILQFAWEVAQKQALDPSAIETHQQVTPRKVARPGGTRPVYRGSTSFQNEYSSVAELVAGFKSLGVLPHEIGVLYPRNERGRIDCLYGELKRDNDVCWISNKKDTNGGIKSLDRPGVRLSTIHSAKGLEFTAVIVVAADLFQDPKQAEPEDTNLLYVGLTRATHHLAVTWTGSSPLADLIAASKWAAGWGLPQKKV